MSWRLLFWFFVLPAAIFEAAGDIILKKWASDGKLSIFIFGLLVYLVSTILFALSMKYEFLSKAIAIVTVLNLLIVVLAGVFIFKENLTLINKIGILLGIISIVLIDLK